ncbi:dual specificity mitogen-activated protein kinase kinase 5-like [Clavelina lepadiformis]|uniref:mitogen-activated protein kinase kinase n=1 Tax=Clavelina lepadiformis TaxID=159417 RepID=A0ABP0FN00_CLALP
MQNWSEPNLVIRICFNPGHQVDWNVPFSRQITFQDVLDVVSQASNGHLLVTAFEYEDEDGDRITVKTDDELKAMLSFYTNSPFDSSSHGAFISDPMMECNQIHLTIYPKIAKPSRRRNVHDLKVAIAPTASSMLLSKNRPELASFSSNRLPNGLYDTKTTNTMQKPAPFRQDQTNFKVQQNMNISTSQTGGNVFLDMQNQVRPTISKTCINIIQDSLSFELGHFSNDTLLFLETLGNGNSGVVQKAIHKESQTITAVKSITVDLTGEEQRRILQELEILRRCNGSPYIIAFYGAYFDENRVLLCTEFMDGGSLDRYGKIPDNVLRNVACAITYGLQHLWSLRIMHRDVKPSNILVNTNGYIKLCDFGVSTQLVDSIARTYVGTNAYMAPERVIGHDYTIYSDVWSFGLSLCELAIGKFPYPQLQAKLAGSRGVVPMEVMQCIVNEAAPRLPTQSVSPDLCDFVQCCLQKEAENRPSPDQLCRHKLVTLNRQSSEIDNLALVSSWITAKLHAIS